MKDERLLEISSDAAREYPDEIMCPGCGKFVGAYEKCPYCGAELKKRMSIVFFRRAALVVAFGGLFLLWLTATQMEPPLIEVGEITNNYNNAVVKVQGKVLGTRNLKEDGIKIRLDDGTGEISCMAFRGRKQMREAGNLPHAGDQATIIGSLQITDRFGTSLMINVPAQVKVDPVKPVTMQIGELTREDENMLVEIRGEVVKAWPGRKKTDLLIGDTSGVVRIPLWTSDFSRLSREQQERITKEGNELTIVGTVGVWRDKIQLGVRDMNEIEVLFDDRIPTNEIPRWGKRERDEAREKEPEVIEREIHQRSDQPVIAF